MLQILLHMLYHAVVVGHHIAVDVGLGTALVVGIGGGDAIARGPFVVVGPTVGIVDVLLVGVDGIERHQALVIHATGPKAARTDAAHVGVEGGVGILGHEIVVHFPCYGEHVVGNGGLRRDVCRQDGQD